MTAPRQNPMIDAINQMGSGNTLHESELSNILESSYQKSKMLYEQSQYQFLLELSLFHAVQNNNLRAVKWIIQKLPYRKWEYSSNLLNILDSSIQQSDNNAETKDESIKNRREIILFLLPIHYKFKSDIHKSRNDFTFEDIAINIINREYKKHLDTYVEWGMKALQYQNHYFFHQLWKLVFSQTDVCIIGNYSTKTINLYYGWNFLTECLKKSAENEPLTQVIKSIEIIGQCTTDQPTPLPLTYLLAFGSIDSALRYILEQMKNDKFEKEVYIDEIFRIHKERNLSSPLYQVINFILQYNIRVNTLEKEKKEETVNLGSLYSYLIHYCNRNKECEEDGIKSINLLLNKTYEPLSAKDLDLIFSYSNSNLIEAFKSFIINSSKPELDTMPNFKKNIWKFSELADKLVQGNVLRPTDVYLKNLWKNPNLLSNLLETKVLFPTLKVGQNTWLYSVLESYRESKDINLKPKLIDFIKTLSKWNVPVEPTDLDSMTSTINDFDILSSLIEGAKAKNLFNDKVTLKRNKYLENIIKQGNLRCISYLLDTDLITNMDFAFEAALINGDLDAIKCLLFKTGGRFPEKIMNYFPEKTKNKKMPTLLNGDFTFTPDQYNKVSNQLNKINNFLKAILFIENKTSKSFEKKMHSSSSTGKSPVKLDGLSDSDQEDLYVLFALRLNKYKEGVEDKSKGPAKKSFANLEKDKDKELLTRMILGDEIVNKAKSKGIKPTYQQFVSEQKMAEEIKNTAPPSAPPQKLVLPSEEVPKQTTPSAPVMQHQEPAVESKVNAPSHTKTEPSAPELSIENSNSAALAPTLHFDKDVNINKDLPMKETKQEIKKEKIEELEESQPGDASILPSETTKSKVEQSDSKSPQSEQTIENMANDKNELTAKEAEPGLHEISQSTQVLFAPKSGEHQKQKTESQTEIDTILSNLLKHKEVLKHRNCGPQLISLVEQMMKIENKQEANVEPKVVAENKTEKPKEKIKSPEPESTSSKKKNIIL